MLKKLCLLIGRMYKLLFDKPNRPRAGWEEEFKRMAKDGDDKLLFPDTLENDFDRYDRVW